MIRCVPVSHSRYGLSPTAVSIQPGEAFRPSCHAIHHCDASGFQRRTGRGRREHPLGRNHLERH